MILPLLSLSHFISTMTSFKKPKSTKEKRRSTSIASSDVLERLPTPVWYQAPRNWKLLIKIEIFSWRKLTLNLRTWTGLNSANWLSPLVNLVVGCLSFTWFLEISSNCRIAENSSDGIEVRTGGFSTTREDFVYFYARLSCKSIAEKRKISLKRKSFQVNKKVPVRAIRV